MEFRPFYLLKCAQISMIVLILWRIYSEYRICGRFVPTEVTQSWEGNGKIQVVLSQGIEGTCRRLFFYLPPGKQKADETSQYLAHLRLWWMYDGENFLPPKPREEELVKISKQIKEDMAEKAKTVLNSGNYSNGMGGGAGRGRRKRKAERDTEEDVEIGREEVNSEFSRKKMRAILPEEEEKPAEMLELDKYASSSVNTSWKWKRRIKRENEGLPWVEMKKSAILPHEESKKRIFPLNALQNEEIGEGERTVHKLQLEGREDGGDGLLHCFELELNEFSTDEEKAGRHSPLGTLSNRSVATVAVGFCHLLLLFAQVYLLNCLEVDNLEQRRGKLFLELLIIFLGCLGWLVVVLLKIRTELDWNLIWMCTNFSPEIFKMLIFIQVFASAILLLGLVEGLHIFFKMRKCSRMIETERENDLKPQRPPI